MENMPGMGSMSPPTNATDHQMYQSPPTMTMIMSHMTFFWGKNAQILFSGWPGTRTGMYILALVFVFVLALLVEWLSNCMWVRVESGKNGGSVSCGVIRALLYGAKVALGYLVMLAVMSFNVGVLIVVVAGHTVGFFLFGSKVFKNSADSVGI